METILIQIRRGTTHWFFAASQAFICLLLRSVRNLRGSERLRKIAILPLLIVAIALFALPVKANPGFQVKYMCTHNYGKRFLGVGGLAYLYDRGDTFGHSQNHWVGIGVEQGTENTFIEAGIVYDKILDEYVFFVTKVDHGVKHTDELPDTYEPGEYGAFTICRDKFDTTGKSWHVFIYAPNHYYFRDVIFSDEWTGYNVATSFECDGSGVLDYAANENKIVADWSSLSYLEPVYWNWEYWGSLGYSRTWFAAPEGGPAWLGTVIDPEAQYGYRSAWYAYVPNVSSSHIRYHRSDDWTINYITGHKFEPYEGDFMGAHYKNKTGTYSTVSWGFRIWQRNINGIEKEITVDDNDQPVYIEKTVNCYFPATHFEVEWTPPLNRVPFHDGDNLVLRMYVRWNGGSWSYADRWVSEAIWNTAGKGIRYIEPFVWSLHWYLECKLQNGISYAIFHCGQQYYFESRIENMDFTYGEHEGSFMRLSSPPFNPIVKFKQLSG